MIAQRRQLRAEDLKDAGTGARTLNELLLDIYRKLETIGVDVEDIYVTINNLTPTALALAVVGTSPNTSGASVSYSDPTYTLTLQPTDGDKPGVISGLTNQVLGKTGIVQIFNSQVSHTATLSMSSTSSIWFNGSSAHAIRYNANVTTGMQFVGDNFEFNFTTTAGQLYCAQRVSADRFSIIAKDDQSATPGSFTTTRSAGRAAIAAGATGLVITNNTSNKAFAATDDVYWSWIDDDATAVGMKVVAAANTITFTVAGGLTATANTRFAWWVLK